MVNIETITNKGYVLFLFFLFQQNSLQNSMITYDLKVQVDIEKCSFVFIVETKIYSCLAAICLQLRK